MLLRNILLFFLIDVITDGRSCILHRYYSFWYSWSDDLENLSVHDIIVVNGQEIILRFLENVEVLSRGRVH